MPASMFPGASGSLAAQLESNSMTWEVPTCSPAQGLSDGPPVGQAATSGTYQGRFQSYNWSGYEVFPDTGHTYTLIEANWKVPAVTSSTGASQYTSSWLGLGSGSGTDSSGQQYLLDQAGTLQSVVNGAKQYSFFWELFPENSEQTTQPPPAPNNVALPEINPGNQVDVSIIHDNGASSSQIALTNLTSDVGTIFSVSWGSGYAEGGGQAEWIMERPIISNAYPQLADYGKITFQNMYVENNTYDGVQYYPGELTRRQIYMTNCTLSTTLSSPENLVNGGAENNSGTIDWETSGTGGDGKC